MKEKKLVLDLEKFGDVYDITFPLDSFEYIINMGIEQDIEFFEKLKNSIKELQNEIEKDEASSQFN